MRKPTNLISQASATKKKHIGKKQVIIGAAVLAGVIAIGSNVAKNKTPDHTQISDMEFQNGVYTGQLSKDEIDGVGTFTFKTGEVYSGEWSGGSMNGDGTYTYAN